MRITAEWLKEIAQDARHDYDEWKKANPGQDPVRNPLPDALWNLEAAAQRVNAELAELERRK